MANPQKENGFTAIANEILEKIVATSLPAGEFRLLFFVLRKTYGYQKKEDRISLTQFEKGLKLSRPTVSKYLKNLKARNILVVTPLLGIKFNKDWDSWVVATPLLVKNKKKPSSYAPTKSGSPAPTHKRKKEKTKERIAETSSAFPFILEEKLKDMEKVENSYLDIIASFIREKPVLVENSKQLSAIITRYCRVAQKIAGAYTNKQIFEAIERIKQDDKEMSKHGNGLDWTVETIYKKLTK